jgi:AcrR family transcriptional regulator
MTEALALSFEAPARAPQAPRARVRMTGVQRRLQLLDVGCSLFAERGFDATTIEEIAHRAEVSKPVIYGHFGGKDGLYAAVVDREMTRLLEMVTHALSGGHPRKLLEQAASAFLDYVENYTDGYRILLRGSGVGSASGTLTTLLGELANRVAGILAAEFRSRGYATEFAPMYAQMLVGMVALTGQWWLDVREPRRDDVVAQVVNLAWNGLSQLDPQPRLWSTD